MRDSTDFTAMEPQEVRRIRSRLGLTQTDFGRLLSVSKTTVYNWETGTHGVPPLKAGVIRQLDAQAQKREEKEREEWLNALLVLAVGGLFSVLLSKIFGGDDAS
jgi:DNA-binding XRE family transcriptional regulator